MYVPARLILNLLSSVADATVAPTAVLMATTTLARSLLGLAGTTTVLAPPPISIVN